MRGQRYHGLERPIPAGSALGAAAAAAAVIGLVWARPFRVAVEGVSMSPTLEPGDFLVATGRGHPRRGALVVLDHPKQPGLEVVKRLVGRPGDAPAGMRLGSDEHWVAGDNPSWSTDSRAFGPVSRGRIAGVVRLRYWPPSRIGWIGRRTTSARRAATPRSGPPTAGSRS